ncbi:hypothetical protein [Mucilaginibacter sp. CSA2-8R]|uniref:hypothetical protein n=1 Tax=Mucilaginibacter sp. CSA2-8R TaxID=3141542 RepID=UPI00315D0646
MKKMICMVALAAISFGTVFAHGPIVSAKADVAAQDTVKKKMKKKNGKMKVKVKKDTTATKM